VTFQNYACDVSTLCRKKAPGIAPAPFVFGSCRDYFLMLKYAVSDWPFVSITVTLQQPICVGVEHGTQRLGDGHRHPFLLDGRYRAPLQRRARACEARAPRDDYGTLM